MPATPPTVGVKFVVCEVSNADGGTVTISATVTDAAGRFTLEAVNTGASAAQMVLMPNDIPFEVPPGLTVFPVPGARRWGTSRFTIMSAARTG
jgi:hypothetical protein